jgi:hypothetical protein
MARLARLSAFFGWAMLALAVVAGVRKTITADRAALCALIISVQWVNQSFFSLHSHLESSITYAGPMLALAFFLFDHVSGLVNKSQPIARALSIWLAIGFGIASCSLYSFHYNHSGYVPIYVDKRLVSVPSLKGIMETPERSDTLEQLVEAYERLDCENKIFITAQSTPLLNYLFNKKSPRDLGYIRPAFIYPEERIFEELNSGSDWCVFYSENFNEQRGGRKMKALLGYLAENSERIIPLREGPPRHKHDDFVIYIGPVRSKKADPP